MAYDDSATPLAPPEPGAKPFEPSDLAPLQGIQAPATPRHSNWAEQWPIVFDLIGEDLESRRIDDRTLVDTMSRLRPVHRLPRFYRKTWPSRITVLADRSPHLVPIWADQNRLIDDLRRVLGPTQVRVV